jgi:hypothetical protein
MTGAFRRQVADHEELGDLGAALGAVQRGLESQGRTKALLVVHCDRIVCEWYAPDCGPTVPHYTASLAKALVGGVTLTLCRRALRPVAPRPRAGRAKGCHPESRARGLQREARSRLPVAGE